MDELFTSRTRLRRLARSDLNNLARLQTDPDVVRFTRARIPQTLDEIESRLSSWINAQAADRPLGIWVAELRDGGEFFGWFMLRKSEFDFPELGFMISKNHWGKGLTSEVSQALVDWAFKDLGLPGVSAVTDRENVASIRILEKLGFQKMETKMKHDLILDRDVELFIFELRAGGLRS